MKSSVNEFGKDPCVGRKKSFGNGKVSGQETHRIQVSGTVISGDKYSQLQGCVVNCETGRGNVSNNYYYVIVVS